MWKIRRPVDTGGRGAMPPPIICQTCFWRCYKRSLIWQQFWQQFILAIHAPPIPVQLSTGLKIRMCMLSLRETAIYWCIVGELSSSIEFTLMWWEKHVSKFHTISLSSQLLVLILQKSYKRKSSTCQKHCFSDWLFLGYQIQIPDNDGSKSCCCWCNKEDNQ